MREEYDFSKAEKGKFYREKALFKIPLYLEEDVVKDLQDQARKSGTDLETLANQWLKRDIAAAKSANG